MSYTPAIAETSKNNVLTQLAPDTKLVMDDLVDSFVSSFYYVLICVLAILAIFFTLLLVYFVAMGMLSPIYGLVMFILAIFVMIAIGYGLYAYFASYCRKEFMRANDVFDNFISSEEVLTIIDDAANVYLEAL